MINWTENKFHNSGCIPPDEQNITVSHLSIIWRHGDSVPVYVSSHAKVSNLYNPAWSLCGQQTVPGCNVPVNEVALLQVPAALCNIHGTQQQVLHCERRWPFLHHTTTTHQLLQSSCWAICINHSSDHWRGNNKGRKWKKRRKTKIFI